MEKSNQSFMERPNIEELVTTRVILLHQLFCIYLIYGKFNGTLSLSLSLCLSLNFKKNHLKLCSMWVMEVINHNLFFWKEQKY